MGKLHNYSTCGFHVESEISLSNLPETDAAPDVSIRYGTIEDFGDDPEGFRRMHLVEPGKIVIKVPTVGLYQVNHGREILIQPNPGVEESEIRVFLQCSVWGALLHQRNLLPLHASVIRVGESSVAFSGHCGAGKSTLGTYLQQSGYDLMSDDICPLSITPEVVMAAPSFPRVKLWEASANALQVDQTLLQPVRPKMKKFEFNALNSHQTSPLPLKVLYLLGEVTEVEEEGVFPINGIERLHAIREQTYRFYMTEKLGLAGQHFQQSAQALKSLQIFSLRRVRKFDRLSLTRELLERHWQELSLTSGKVTHDEQPSLRVA